MPTYKQKFVITKENGDIKGIDPVVRAIHDLQDGKYLLEVSKYYRKRSDAQRGFYFGNYIQSEIDCFKEFWGETYTKEQMHEFNKINFFGTEKMIEGTGEIVKIPESSTEKTTIQWEEDLEKGRQWFRQTFSWEISYPEQQAQINY